MVRSSRTKGGGDKVSSSNSIDSLIYRLTLLLFILGITGIVLFIPFPLTGVPVIETLWGEPLLFILLFGWYVCRPGFAMLAHIFHRRWHANAPGDDPPPAISILIPAYNEERCISETIAAIYNQEYDAPVETIVVDDGSTDNTWDVLCTLESEYSGLRVFTKENEGRPATRNAALSHASHDIIVSIDADTIFEEKALAEIVKPFDTSDIVAVAGNVQVNNRAASLWTRLQTIEYPLAMELARMFQSRLRHLLCISGGFGAFRRKALEEVGAWNNDPYLADDFEVSIKMHTQGKVWFNPHAVGLTNVPTTVLGWAKQRIRWARNGLRTIVLHHKAQFNPNYSLAGLFGLPLKLILSALLLVKVGSIGYALLTSPVHEIQQFVVVVPLVAYTVTAGLSLLLFATLVATAVYDRPFEQYAFLPIYVLVYRVLHIAVKIIGFVSATVTLLYRAIYATVVPSYERGLFNDSITDESKKQRRLFPATQFAFGVI